MPERHRPKSPHRAAPEDFTVLEPLSEGKHTTVTRARSRRHGEVVLKVLHESPAHPRARKVFEREARLHAALSPDAAPHPNIVAFVAASDEDDEQAWIATRPGGAALSDVLAKRSLGADEALRVSRDILDGLTMLHQRGLVHGDLTPRNIVVYNGRATLCDLGLAGPAGQTSDSAQVGTPEYMAPELLSDSSRAPDTRSDVYAAGLIIGEVLAGHPLTRDVDHLVYDRASSTRASDRPADAQEFARDLTAGGRVVGTAFPRRRRSWAMLVAAVLTLAALAGFAWMKIRPAQGMVSPINGSRTVSPIWSQGRAPIAEHESVWFIQRSGKRPYEISTHPATIDPDRGGWFSTEDLGFGPCDEGFLFDIWVFALPNDSPIVEFAKNKDFAPFADLTELPRDGRELGHARVTMTQFQGMLNRCPGASQDVDSVVVG